MQIHMQIYKYYCRRGKLEKREEGGEERQKAQEKVMKM